MRHASTAILSRFTLQNNPDNPSGACGEGYFRFSMFGSPKDTAEAARRLEALLTE